MIDFSNYQQNITEFPSREISNVYVPESEDDLRDIVVQANENFEPVYPISTGHNWGLGSKLPVNDGSIIDLSKLNKIIEVNRELAYARIQPGVTQKQLYDYLEIHAPELMVNVTGADAHSSVIGNMMDRGSGKSGHKAEDIRELKILLANGEEICTGFGGMRKSGTDSFYKYGVGPDITHLFTQSNFGIITECVVNLLPKQAFSLYLVKMTKTQLADFFEVVSQQVRIGHINYSLEVDSHNDPKIHRIFDGENLSSEDHWYAWFVTQGDPEIRKAKDRLVREALKDCTVEIRDYRSEEDHSDAVPPVRARIRRYNGEPCDETLISWASAFGIEMDENDVDIDNHKNVPGFRCILPVFPFSRAAAGILDRVAQFSEKAGVEPVFSAIALNGYAIECFIRVHFDRSKQEEIDKASRWASELLEFLREDDIFPYRLDIENMGPYLEKTNDPKMKWLRQIKEIFDGRNIISNGRYVI